VQHPEEGKKVPRHQLVFIPVKEKTDSGKEKEGESVEKIDVIEMF
jgi:hypothetical protein